jgi:hypothetical protein
MQTAVLAKQFLNPVVFSNVDDGNPNCVGIEALPIFVNESPEIVESNDASESARVSAGIPNSDDAGTTPTSPT